MIMLQRAPPRLWNLIGHLVLGCRPSHALGYAGKTTKTSRLRSIAPVAVLLGPTQFLNGAY